MSIAILVVVLPILRVMLTTRAFQAARKYQISHLLKPQREFEINLYFSNFTSFSTQILPPSLLHSIEYLVDNQAPFRLYYNLARKAQPSLIIRASRHSQHQVTHLVFVMLQSNVEEVNLDVVFHTCLVPRDQVSSTIHKDLVQLIPDESKLSRTVRP